MSYLKESEGGRVEARGQRGQGRGGSRRPPPGPGHTRGAPTSRFFCCCPPRAFPGRSRVFLCRKYKHSKHTAPSQSQGRTSSRDRWRFSANMKSLNGARKSKGAQGGWDSDDQRLSCNTYHPCGLVPNLGTEEPQPPNNFPC